jgi:hypothetical protein
MTHIFGYLGIALGVAVVVLGITASVVSNRFFKHLVVAHPELADAFPKEPLIVVGRRGGPIRPSFMTYLKEHRYDSLPDPNLRKLGRRSWVLLASYAVVFTAWVVSLLLWNYFRANGP